MRRALVVLLVFGTLAAGCVDRGGLAQLQGNVTTETIEWGEAAQFTIRNVGEQRAQAPIRVEIVAPNGSVVRTYPDVTGGRGIPPGGQVSLSWNGLSGAGRPVLWGNYTFRVVPYGVTGHVQLLRPPNYAIDVDPDPRKTERGNPVTFTVENTGNIWLNGSLTVAAGRQGNLFYNHTVEEVRLPPGGHYNLTWNGQNRSGEPPEAKRYLVAARMDLVGQDQPTPFSQDFFELTKRRSR